MRGSIPLDSTQSRSALEKRGDHALRMQAHVWEGRRREPKAVAPVKTYPPSNQGTEATTKGGNLWKVYLPVCNYLPIRHTFRK